ncbi:MAG: DNA topoisomerase IB [Beijerinckiaceae bacterium]|nr:DNA topoisomerase IB [Beijerinckiaceae bacterium]
MDKGSESPAELNEAEEQAQDAAVRAGLRYVSDDEPGIMRKRKGKGFVFLDARGKQVKDAATLDRIRKLAVPPAYENVWICADADGHIQATGRDARGRKQYRYHARWGEVRDANKYERMIAFGSMLPRLRRNIAAHMQRKGLGRRKVLATVVHLLDTTLIRIGNADYARANDSYGLTTLRNKHVAISSSELRFDFKGKSGKMWKLKVRDRRIARIVRQVQELPGQQLFQYIDRDGVMRGVTSSDVNEYLREIANEPISAKDFRTWAGTVLAAMELGERDAFTSATAAKKNVRDAIARVAARLGNTPTICRKCYVHPQVLDSYFAGELAQGLRRKGRAPAKLEPEEAAVLAFLRCSLAETAKGPKPKRVKRAPPSLREQISNSLASA